MPVPVPLNTTLRVETIGIAQLKSVAVVLAVVDVSAVVAEMVLPLRRVVSVLVRADDAVERLAPSTMWLVPVSVRVTGAVPFSVHDTTLY